MTRDDVMRETLKHVRRVGELLGQVSAELIRRANCHDDSKFSVEEFESFAQETPTLRGITYGSPEYREAIARIKPAVELHQKRNDHHPEFHADGIHGMDLIQLLEMLADWKAAGERHADGSLQASIEKNAERFGYDEWFAVLLMRTADRLGWIVKENTCAGAF